MSADSKRSRAITIDDVKGAKSKFGYARSKLNDHQRVLLDQIKSMKEVDFGELFRRHQDSFKDSLGERAYRNQRVSFRQGWFEHCSA